MRLAIALGFLNGVVTTLMNLVNADLTTLFGNSLSTLIIHFSGLVIMAILCLVRFEKISLPKLPFWTWTAGFIGILTILFSNYAFSRIDVTLATAAVLTGQVATGLVFDAVGILGSRKIPIRRRQLFSLALIVLGTVVMVLWR